MNILLVYATYSSGTLTAAQKVHELLTVAGHTIHMQEAAESNPAEFSSYDLIIMGSPSWMIQKKDGMPHEHHLLLMEKAAPLSFESKKFAVFGLGDDSYAHPCGAVDKIEAFIKEKHGTLIIDSLRLKDFYFFEDRNINLLTEWVNRITQL